MNALKQAEVKIIAIAEDGKGNMSTSEEIAYCLTIGGGRPGQNYPCVLIIDDDINDSE